MVRSTTVFSFIFSSNLQGLTYMHNTVVAMIWLAIPFFSITNQAFAQSEEILPSRTAKNTVYVELLGSASTFSLNYERMLLDNVGVRVGGNILSSTQQPTRLLATIPVFASYFIGAASHRAEFGLGAITNIANSQAWDIRSFTEVEFSGDNRIQVYALPTAIIGYRYQPLDGGFNFRATFTPMFGYSQSTQGFVFFPWGGISLGWGF
jgi:hypothetical protein